MPVHKKVRRAVKFPPKKKRKSRSKTKKCSISNLAYYPKRTIGWCANCRNSCPCSACKLNSAIDRRLRLSGAKHCCTDRGPASSSSLSVAVLQKHKLSVACRTTAEYSFTYRPCPVEVCFFFWLPHVMCFERKANTSS